MKYYVAEFLESDSGTEQDTKLFDSKIDAYDFYYGNVRKGINLIKNGHNTNVAYYLFDSSGNPLRSNIFNVKDF